jgi:hypothetical protein
MENLVIPNYKNYINKKVLDWNISECEDVGPIYAIILKKESLERIFFIRKIVIKGSKLRLDNDVYELWYKNFEESRVLTLSEILDTDIVLSKIEELLNKYSQYE